MAVTALKDVPQIDDLLRNCTIGLLVMWIIGGVCVIVSHVIVYRHIWSLKRQSGTPGTRRRDLICEILGLGTTLSACYWLCMILPRNYPFFHVIVTLRLSFTMHDLFLLFLNLLAGENEHDPRVASMRVVSILSRMAPHRFFLVAPLGPLFFWVPPQKFGKLHLRTIRYCTRQFIYLLPALSVLELNASLQGQMPETLIICDRVLNFFSAMLAVWSVNVLRRATSVLMPEYSTGLKAGCLQVMFLVSTITSLLVPSIVKKLPRSTVFNLETMQIEFMGFLGCILGLIFSIVLVRVFTIVDLTTNIPTATIEARAQECDEITAQSHEIESGHQTRDNHQMPSTIYPEPMLENKPSNDTTPLTSSHATSYT